MDAGPSSAPVMHQMQPAAPRPAPLPVRVPGAPPRGPLRPNTIPGQRQGPVVTMPPPQNNNNAAAPPPVTLRPNSIPGQRRGPVVPMPTAQNASSQPRAPIPAPAPGRSSTRPQNATGSAAPAKNPIPPTVFRFQAIKKPAVAENTSPKPAYTAPTPAPNLPVRTSILHTKLRTPGASYDRHAPLPSLSASTSYSRHDRLLPSTSTHSAAPIPRQSHSQAHTSAPPHRVYTNGHTTTRTHDMPSTSTATLSFKTKTNSKSPYFKVTDSNREELQGQQGLWMSSQGEMKADRITEKESETTIELPENCKIFQYQCLVNSIERTLLVPMPINATEEDVMKMLPESFAEMANQIFANETEPKQTSKLSFHGAPPRIETISGMEDKFPSFNNPPPPAPSAPNPILVNPKQFNRILIRRKMRQKLEMSGRLPLERQKYLHESRHLHAIKRRRGVDGRFDPKMPPLTGAGVSLSGPSKKYAQPLSRPVTTYAEIRPAHEINIYDDNSTSSAGPSTSTASYFDRNEPITNYHQYQQHVQYDSDHYQPNGASHVDNSNTHQIVIDETAISNEFEQSRKSSREEDFTNL